MLIIDLYLERRFPLCSNTCQEIHHRVGDAEEPASVVTQVHNQIRHINGNVHNRYETVDDFYSEWRWEICYFNCLFAGFAELFAPKKEVA